MSKRSFSVPSYTPAATADTTNLANNSYLAIGAANNSTGLLVSEIYLGGQASASSINIQQFARDSTLGATPTALAAPVSDGPLHTLASPNFSQSGSITYNAAATAPQRSANVSAARLNLSLNSFGGIVRWVAYPGEEWGIVATTASASESTLSCFTGGSPGLISSHIIYEIY